MAATCKWRLLFAGAEVAVVAVVAELGAVAGDAAAAARAGDGAAGAKFRNRPAAV